MKTSSFMHRSQQFRRSRTWHTTLTKVFLGIVTIKVDKRFREIDVRYWTFWLFGFRILCIVQKRGKYAEDDFS